MRSEETGCGFGADPGRSERASKSFPNLAAEEKSIVVTAVEMQICVRHHRMNRQAWRAGGYCRGGVESNAILPFAGRRRHRAHRLVWNRRNRQLSAQRIACSAELISRTVIGGGLLGLHCHAGGCG